MSVKQTAALGVAGGLGSPILYAGTPTNGTSEIQAATIGGSPTGGTFTLTFEGFTTTPLAYNASSATVQAALRALVNIGAGGCSVSGSAGGPYTIAFSGNLAKKNVSAMTANASGLTGGSSPTVTVTTPTPGVNATGRGAATGARLVDTNTGNVYTNNGSGVNPSWFLMPRMFALTETVLFSQFTAGGASGTYDFLTGLIPIGAYVLFSKVVVNTGFTGDTTAVLTIGDGTTAARYNTGTVNVLAAATDGISAGDPSGVRYHTVAKTPRLTVTSAANFASVNAGSLTVTIYYMATV